MTCFHVASVSWNADAPRVWSLARARGRRTGWAAFALVVCAAVTACGRKPPSPSSAETVVFVCPHGSAKSVLAAALFEERAKARGLPHRALARGIDPDPALAPAVVAGLAADGRQPTVAAPARFVAEEARGAGRVVTFGPLPAALTEGAVVETWESTPSVTRAYAAARDDMIARIDALLDALERTRR